MNDTDSITARLVELLKRDPKRTAILAVLVAVLGGMWAKMLLKGSGVPATASAASTLSAPVGVGPGSVKHNPRTDMSFDALERWATGPVAPVTRNLFVIQREFYPMVGGRSPQGVRREDDSFWAMLEKSMSDQADQRQKRENQIANYKAEAARLGLQSIVMGPTPRALINGEFVGEGSVIASFRVVKIEARRIIVEREGIRLEIQMN